MSKKTVKIVLTTPAHGSALGAEVEADEKTARELIRAGVAKPAKADSKS